MVLKVLKLVGIKKQWKVSAGENVTQINQEKKLRVITAQKKFYPNLVINNVKTRFNLLRTQVSNFFDNFHAVTEEKGKKEKTNLYKKKRNQKRAQKQDN